LKKKKDNPTNPHRKTIPIPYKLLNNLILFANK
jgi:hypothetical protein